MKYQLIRFPICFVLLVILFIVSCDVDTYSIPEIEKILVGEWKKVDGKEAITLRENREVKDLSNFFSLKNTRWDISLHEPTGDVTLIMQGQVMTKYYKLQIVDRETLVLSSDNSDTKFYRISKSF